MHKLRTLILLLVFPLIAYSQQPNFIVIIADDLNDYIGVLGGHPQVETPYMDSLAASGLNFMNAYCSSPGCAPSRTSMLSGKDPNYTKVFNNEDYESVFRNNFTVEQDNAEVYTLPQILKDSGNYFTYALDKVFHKPGENDYDKFSATCEKNKSWNRMTNVNAGVAFNDLLNSYAFSPDLDFGMIPDSLESQMEDFIAADSAASFIHQYANGTVNTCDKPFFLALGLHKPHTSRLIPEKYFPPFYMQNLFADTFAIIYNNPAGSFPYNGLVMPPQPVPMFNDFYELPEGGLAQSMANNGDIYNTITDYTNSLPYIPEICPGLTEEERIAITQETIRANYVAAYIAAVQFVDAMIGKVMDELAEHPELADNTVIILTSDHGYSLGEKRHWTKWSLWETDTRVPLIIKYPGFASNTSTNRVVSLLDIYPTICDMAEVNHPVMEDGSRYLDGNSFIALFNDPGNIQSNVAVTTYKKNAGMGSCYPHVSFRNERFHYIRYQYNNDAGEGGCDPLSQNFDVELYDIGTDRQTDPYEWNNLADNPEYAPVLNYFEAFLPNGSLYNMQPFTVNIYSDDVTCLLNNDDHIPMRAKLFYPNGDVISPDSLSNYTLTWTNNLTAEVFDGYIYTFDMNTVSPALFAISDDINFYLNVTETATGKVCAFKMKQFNVNDATMPDITYSTVVIDHTLNINDIAVTGIASSITWDFGDGYTASQADLGPHYYAVPGTYLLKVTLNYGNKCYVQRERIIMVETAVLKVTDLEYPLLLYPNPSSSVININNIEADGATTIEIYNSIGEMVKQMSVDSDAQPLQVGINTLSSGIYFVKVKTDDYYGTGVFEVIK